MDKPVSRFFNSRAQLWIVYPCVQGGCALSEAGQFWYLKQNRTIWSYLVIFFKIFSVRRWKQNSSFTGSIDPNCALYENFTGAYLVDDYIGHRPSQTAGIFPINLHHNSAHLDSLRNKCQVYLRLCKLRRLECKVQCLTRWILKYRLVVGYTGVTF